MIIHHYMYFVQFHTIPLVREFPKNSFAMFTITVNRNKTIQHDKVYVVYGNCKFMTKYKKGLKDFNSVIENHLSAISYRIACNKLALCTNKTQNSKLISNYKLNTFLSKKVMMNLWVIFKSFCFYLFNK